ncbi:MAG TPA: energy transducer TonB [Bryobacteraceae bacterium]|jgi:protein TonB|nr:energy transducer TonB [Bryobacteraceae bacterium]
MFDQTFVDTTHQSGKPATLALSLLMQAAVICILVSLPLVYTQTLPFAQLRNLVVAPAAPRTAVSHQAVRTQTKPAWRVFAAPQLFAPARVPTGIHPAQDVPAAPEIGPVPSTAGSAGPSILGVIGSVGEAAPPPAATKPEQKGPVRMGGNVAAANLIRRVQPVYPPLARTARVQGSVEFTAKISREGNIEDLTLVRGHPLLVKAAQDAVLQWKYRPTLLNGQPVEVVTEITVNFMLSQ